MRENKNIEYIISILVSIVLALIIGALIMLPMVETHRRIPSS